MDFALLILGPLLVSAAIGVGFNRFILGKIKDRRLRAFACATSRAVFYAPSLEHVGHGIHLPMPVVLVLIYSQRQFGPDVGLLTFLLPSVVFISSLLVAYSKRLGYWFSGFVVAHIALFGILPFLLSDFDARLKLFEVNALPWYPLHHFFKLPVTEYGWLMLPNEIGWTWCFGVWLALYALLAFALTRLTLRSTGRAKSSAPVS